VYNLLRGFHRLNYQKLTGLISHSLIKPKPLSAKATRRKGRGGTYRKHTNDEDHCRHGRPRTAARLQPAQLEPQKPTGDQHKKNILP